MLIILLKSTACLAILMVFYKLFLENLAIHKFKRFYLIGAIIVSASIPFITFIEYIVPVANKIIVNTAATHSPTEVVEHHSNLELTPIILWCVYGLGVLLFLSKFSINLYRIISKINKNERLKHNQFISVLLKDIVIPHTFLNYIFLNKAKFESKAIPKEVLLHEETHAKQKHSLDILYIELIQVVFWFNPLLYFIKKDIKLNHEFLADEAVLKQGIDSSTYQKTLLKFSSKANEIQLANAINYSLIKKRFTIMKTETSKKTAWLRSLLLLPVLGGLLFSFSSRKQVEKATPIETVSTQEHLKNSLLVNGIVCNSCQLNLSKEGTKQLILGTTSGASISNFKLKIPGINTLNNKGSQLNKETKNSIETQELGTIIQLFDIKTENNESLEPILIILVDKSAKNYTNSPVIKKGEKSNLPPLAPRVYKNKKGKMLPHPPPPPTTSEALDNGGANTNSEYGYRIINGDSYYTTTKNNKTRYFDRFGKEADKNGNVLEVNKKNSSDTGFTEINGETTFYSTINDNTKYYNRWGVEIDKNGNKVNGDKQVESDDVVPNQNIHKVYKDSKVVSIFKIKNGDQQNIPEPPMPPKPESYEDHINRVSKDYDVTFFFENRKISKSEALKLLKKYKKLNMSSHIDNGKGTVHFSKKETTIKK